MAPMAAIILGLCVVLAMGMLIAISRHKKSGTRQPSLVGSIGIVEKAHGPQATLLIEGELWLASPSEGNELAAGSKIEVIGTRDHLLLVRLRAQ